MTFQNPFVVSNQYGTVTYIRSKMINGYGPYYYEVRSVREGKKVRQIFVRYVGKSPEGSGALGPASVVPNTETAPKPKPYLEIEGAGERIEPTGWSALRRERARKIARTTGCNMMQADALAKAVYRSGRDPDTYPYDELQGKDLSYEDKLDRISSRNAYENLSDRQIEAELEERTLEPYMERLQERDDYHDLSEKERVRAARTLYREDLEAGRVDPYAARPRFAQKWRTETT